MSARLPMLFMLALLLVIAQGCSSVNSTLGGNTQDEAKAEVSWDYQRNGIQIELIAAADLNAYFDQPHTLILGVFQLEDSKTFMQLANDAKTLTAMLASGQASTGILHMERYVVSPGTREVLDIDRVQDARFIGIAAGYYRFDPPGAARLFRIPLNIRSEGLVSTTHTAAPANLALRLYLGRQRILNAQSLTFDADAAPNVESIPLEPQETEIKLDDDALRQAGGSVGSVRKLRQ